MITKNNNQIAEYSKTEAELSALREVCATTVFDVKTPSGMKQATSLRAKVRLLRTGIERLRKETKAPILALGKLIDSEATRITDELLALEKPIDELIKVEELRKAEEKKIESDRIAKVQEWFDGINKIIIDCVGQSPYFIKEKIKDVGGNEFIRSMFKERINEAEQAKESAISKLTTMLNLAEQGENDRAELAAKTKQLEELSIKPIDTSLHLVELKGATCTVSVRQGSPIFIHESLLEKSKENITRVEYDIKLNNDELDGIAIAAKQIIEIDNVIIPRAEYDRLLWLTTPKTIETAPLNTEILVTGGESNYWTQLSLSSNKCAETHWLPLPELPIPTTAQHEDASDAMGR